MLFDLDGVLANSFEAWVGVLDECRVRRDLPPLGVEGVLPYWGQGLEADCEALFPGTTPEELVAEYDECFPNHVHRVQPIAGGAQLLATLERLQVATWVVTNSPRALAQQVLDVVGLPGMQQRLTGGDDVAHGKPHPAIVVDGLTRTETSAASAVLVGDTSNDVHAGAAAGVFVVGMGIDADWRIEELTELEERITASMS